MIVGRQHVDEGKPTELKPNRKKRLKTTRREESRVSQESRAT